MSDTYEEEQPVITAKYILLGVRFIDYDFICRLHKRIPDYEIRIYLHKRPCKDTQDALLVMESYYPWFHYEEHMVVCYDNVIKDAKLLYDISDNIPSIIYNEVAAKSGVFTSADVFQNVRYHKLAANTPKYSSSTDNDLLNAIPRLLA